MNLITEKLPQPHALLSAVCLARLTKSGLHLEGMGPTPQQLAGPFLDYADTSWFIHAQQSRDDPLTRGRLADYVQHCTRYPFLIKLRNVGGWGLDHVSRLSPIHLLAYFNLPIALAGDEDPNRTTRRADTSSDLDVDMTALCLASQRGNDDAVRELLDLPNISVNAVGMGGMSPLMWAAGGGHEGVAGMLLDHPKIDVKAVDKEGMTALGWASYYGHVGAAKRLLSHPDIIVNSAANQAKNTPLHHASWRGHEYVVALLLARNDVDVNARNWNGLTALSKACRCGHEGTVKRLLAHPEVKINVKDNEGHTPLSRAAKNGNEGVVRLLLDEPSIQVGTRELVEI